MTIASRILSKYSDGYTFDDAVNFKTIQGFDHWYRRLIDRGQKYTGKVKVDGKVYKNPEEVLKANKLKI